MLALAGGDAPAGDDTVGLIRLAAVAAVFVFVLTFVLAVFGQRGRSEISPQREVALAAGHLDRQTVFENPLVSPIMWLLLTVAQRLPAPWLKQRVQERLVAAGSPNFYTCEEFLAVSMLWGVVTGLVLALGNLMLSDQPSLLGLLATPMVGFGIGFGGYMYHLHSEANDRVHLISKRIPYTLDLVALSMSAGATFTEAVRTVVHEDSAHPFNVELNTVLAEVELGTTRAQALRNLANRVPLESLRSIVASIIQAEGLGTPLSDVLKGQANLLRLQRSVRAEKLAAQASVRILVPSMLILMSVVLAVFAPFIIKALKGKLFS